VIILIDIYFKKSIDNRNRYLSKNKTRNQKFDKKENPASRGISYLIENSNVFGVLVSLR
jgi:hypothetical protein